MPAFRLKSLLFPFFLSGFLSLKAQLPTSFNNSLNGLQFYNNSAIENFGAYLKNADSMHTSILVFGDETVRRKQLTHSLQQGLKDSFKDGGRGLFFPFSILHMPDPPDYVTSHTGNWLYAKNIEATPEMATGIMGATVKTTDPNAGFSIRFSEKRVVPQRLTLFYLATENTFDLVLDIDGTQTVYKTGKGKNRLDILLPQEPHKLTLRFKDSKPGENSFELYGLSLENQDAGGVVIHHAGMIGQKMQHILSEALLKEQLGVLQPKLIILDFEANEFYKKGLKVFDFQKNMVQCIQLLRRSLPEVEIILLSSGDVKRSNIYLDDARLYSEQIRIMSHTQNCIFYDWYWVSGGPYSIEKWHAKGLAEKWLTTLNEKGMNLKSESLAAAFFKTYHVLAQNPGLKSHIYNIDTIRYNRVPVLIETPGDSSHENWQYHKVLHGQTLYGIATMYGVSMEQVMQWNHLISRVLYSGQVLKIESNKKPQISPSPRTVKPVPKPAPKPAPVVFHTVRKGESLFSIAKKYGTTTTKLMQLNKLKSTHIAIGQKLRIR